MKQNFGKGVRSRSLGGRRPIPDSTQSPEIRSDDTSKLTLGRGRTVQSSLETEQAIVPSTSPSHREETSPIAGTCRQPTDDNLVEITTTDHYFQVQPGRLQPERQLKFDGERLAAGDPGLALNLTGSSETFHPEGDSPPSICGGFKNCHVQPSLELEYGEQQAAYIPDMDSEYWGSGPDKSRTVPSGQPALSPSSEGDMDLEPILLLQPESRPISHDQLVVEIKGIYAGLVMVESKCVDADKKQLKAALEKDQARQRKLSNEQWQALIHLHKTLLHEHHDFFLSYQHPSASSALSHLAGKYSMPDRMWRHAIYAFLEVLRHRLPDSRDYMLSFIYIAYSMMALLYETVPAFENTWVECLGDLGRYRMAAEADDPLDCENWNGVARIWYTMATDSSPGTGRLYHRLGTLSRQYSLQQLSLYTRSLTCLHPFEGARESIKMIFNPALDGKAPVIPRSPLFETVFLKAHGLLFYGVSASRYEAAVHQIEEGLLDKYIGLVTSKFRELGVCAMNANIAAIFEYGALREKERSKSVVRLAYEEVHRSKTVNGNFMAHPPSQTSLSLNIRGVSPLPLPPLESLDASLRRNEFQSSIAFISRASKLTFTTLAILLRRLGDENVYPSVHVTLVFLFSLASVDEAMKHMEQDVPWGEICAFLNLLARRNALTSKVWATEFPRRENGAGGPLPEDFAMHGQLYAEFFFPETWFSGATIDVDERSLELPSMVARRVERILWIGARIVSVCTILERRIILQGRR